MGMQAHESFGQYQKTRMQATNAPLVQAAGRSLLKGFHAATKPDHARQDL
jgi:hypothetical protein